VFANASSELISSHRSHSPCRYKLIVVVSACEKFMQGITYASKNLWDASRDVSVTYIYDHPGFTAIGICYAVYNE
jgi:Tctex-1 family